VQTQAFPRFKKRVPCRFDIDETNHRGFVLNLSHGGLFVSSRVIPQVGSRLSLHLSPTGADEAIPLDALVVWKRKVHPDMANIRDPGVGLEIVESNDAYERLVADAATALGAQTIPAGRPSARFRQANRQTDPVPEPAPAGRSFKVRVARVGGPRTRYVEVMAMDDAAARACALDEVGEGWEVMEVTS